MIKLKDYTPEIYYKESRDFQLLGRLYDLVLNSVKTEADLLYNLPLSTNSNEKLLDLLALTLGFKPKHQYNASQLRAVCSVFPDILKHKGSIKAIKIACEALFHSMDISQSLTYDFTGEDNTKLNLYISQEFGDITILNDLLSYVLPAGMSCNIIREFQILNDSNTNIGITDKVKTVTFDTTAASGLVNLAGNVGNYAVSNATYTDSNEDVEGIQPLPGFSINSEIAKLGDN
jgi:hypothetical protein